MGSATRTDSRLSILIKARMIRVWVAGYLAARWSAGDDRSSALHMGFHWKVWAMLEREIGISDDESTSQHRNCSKPESYIFGWAWDPIWQAKNAKIGKLDACCTSGAHLVLENPLTHFAKKKKAKKIIRTGERSWSKKVNRVVSLPTCITRYDAMPEASYRWDQTRIWDPLTWVLQICDNLLQKRRSFHNYLPVDLHDIWESCKILHVKAYQIADNWRSAYWENEETQTFVDFFDLPTSHAHYPWGLEAECGKWIRLPSIELLAVI